MRHAIHILFAVLTITNSSLAFGANIKDLREKLLDLEEAELPLVSAAQRILVLNHLSSWAVDQNSQNLSTKFDMIALKASLELSPDEFFAIVPTKALPDLQQYLGYHIGLEPATEEAYDDGVVSAFEDALVKKSFAARGEFNFLLDFDWDKNDAGRNAVSGETALGFKQLGETAFTDISRYSDTDINLAQQVGQQIQRLNNEGSLSLEDAVTVARAIKVFGEASWQPIWMATDCKVFELSSDRALKKHLEAMLLDPSAAQGHYKTPLETDVDLREIVRQVDDEIKMYEDQGLNCAPPPEDHYPNEIARATDRVLDIAISNATSVPLSSLSIYLSLSHVQYFWNRFLYDFPNFTKSQNEKMSQLKEKLKDWITSTDGYVKKFKVLYEKANPGVEYPGSRDDYASLPPYMWPYASQFRALSLARKLEFIDHLPDAFDRIEGRLEILRSLRTTRP